MSLTESSTVTKSTVNTYVELSSDTSLSQTIHKEGMFRGTRDTTPFFLYKHEGKFTIASIMLSFLRISGSYYAYDMLNISFSRKF